jgi:hypothetical protein
VQEQPAAARSPAGRVAAPAEAPEVPGEI